MRVSKEEVAPLLKSQAWRLVKMELEFRINQQHQGMESAEDLLALGRCQGRVQALKALLDDESLKSSLIDRITDYEHRTDPTK